MLIPLFVAPVLLLSCRTVFEWLCLTERLGGGLGKLLTVPVHLSSTSLTCRSFPEIEIRLFEGPMLLVWHLSVL